MEKQNIIEAVRRHPLYQEYYERLKLAEAERKFCRHRMEHFLDVARIAYIQNLEQGMGFRREMIYAAAILHDIGKARQYEEGIPHEVASAEIAEVILKDVSSVGNVRYFSSEEQREILCAIREHRKYSEDMTPLGKLLYTSDKKSRQCYVCPVEQECNWSMEKKNMEIDL